ncbi:response regulator transcription factor [Clostridium sp. E02]|uniref:response regulator transcription factor n=1 Tax=Clostridium sp. E02 TaxID=2487134 RepID=UPI000F54B7E5|nr:response regulator transcription factor [Clostridium sp. E02]
MEKILVIDDDDEILKLMKACLNKQGYLVYTMDKAYHHCVEDFKGYDMILLDIMMPEKDGYEVLSEIREKVSCPIIFLSALSKEHEKIKGLLAGADDYIAKPFSLDELTARVKAHLRREKRAAAPKTLDVDGVTFYLESREIYVNGKNIPLTNYEYRICELLAQNRNRVFTKEELYNRIYEENSESDAQIRTITEFIYQVRKKFSIHKIEPIKTIWGVGYKWVNQQP